MVYVLGVQDLKTQHFSMLVFHYCFYLGLYYSRMYYNLSQSVGSSIPNHFKNISPHNSN